MADLLNPGSPLDTPTSQGVSRPQPFRIGVLADTHVPDRRHQLDPRILKAFREAGVDLIFHAGDISTQIVLDQLGEIAPVEAVRGNRDWMMLGHLPSALQVEINGVSLALTHGHGSPMNYFIDRLYYYRYGFRMARYLPRLQSTFPASQAIIFGHIHRPCNQTIEGQLLFNPGSAQVPDLPYAPSAGIIQISPEGEIQARIFQLMDISSE